MLATPERLVMLTQVAPPAGGADLSVAGPWSWLLVGHGVLFMTLAFYAGHVALSGNDKQRRADGFKVLKLVWGTVGVTGLTGIILHLPQVDAW